MECVLCDVAVPANAARMSEATQILNRAQHGDPNAAGELLSLVYGELRKLATARLGQEHNQTLQATELVHEAWLKLAGSNQDWSGRSHFFAAAAESMRRILIERARRRRRVRHGGGLQRVNLDDVELATTTDDETLLRLDAALAELEVEDPEKTRLIKLRYFVGLTIPDAARALGISPATAKRHWAYGRAWLYCQLTSKD
jgi:RNA polymerase sigma factor (TIGR02999 family)